MPRDELGNRKTKDTKAKRNVDHHGKYGAKAVRKYESMIATTCLANGRKPPQQNQREPAADAARLAHGERERCP